MSYFTVEEVGQANLITRKKILVALLLYLYHTAKYGLFVLLAFLPLFYAT